MNILYINDELATSDGSNYHALGILTNLQKLLGEEHVRSYPAPVNGSELQTNRGSMNWRQKHKNLLQIIRIVRKTFLSHIRSHRLVKELKSSGWIPTHVIARSVIFDTTAILVAKHLHAKLIYEVNAPMYYEHCVINHLPLSGAIERWERNILQRSDYVYAVSDTCRDMLCEHYNLNPDKFIVIPNGYMEELYDISSDTQETIRNSIRTFEKMENKFVVTFIGSLKTWHGITKLCELASSLESNPHIHFLVAGDGTEYSQIETYCQNHTNMTYKGKLNLTQMAHYLLASDLGIMPYEQAENFYFSPLKMYDMIGAGLPFIGTDQGQIHSLCNELLHPDFLLQNNQVEEARQRIEELAQDNARYLAMKDILHHAQPYTTWNYRTRELLTFLTSSK